VGETASVDTATSGREPEKHRTEVTEVTEGERGLGAKRLTRTRRPAGEYQEKHRTEVTEVTEGGSGLGAKLVAGTWRAAGEETGQRGKAMREPRLRRSFAYLRRASPPGMPVCRIFAWFLLAREPLRRR
jgi:hypothetical protein